MEQATVDMILLQGGSETKSPKRLDRQPRAEFGPTLKKALTARRCIDVVLLSSVNEEKMK